VAEAPNQRGHLRVEALMDQKSYRKTLDALNRVALHMEQKFPASTLNKISTYGLRYLRALTPRYVDTHRHRPHNRPGGDGSPTIGMSWVQSKLRKGPAGWRKTLFNTKMATNHGRTVLRVLETGSRPHAIPRNPKTGSDNPSWLKFYWEAVGHVVMARQVFHPGTRPYQVVGKTYHRLLFLLDQMKAIAAGEAVAVFERPRSGGFSLGNSDFAGDVGSGR